MRETEGGGTLLHSNTFLHAKAKRGIGGKCVYVCVEREKIKKERDVNG